MVSSWDKNLIAENCAEFKASMPIMNMRSMANSCSNCANYMNGKCNKELFEEMVEKIRIN